MSADAAAPLLPFLAAGHGVDARVAQYVAQALGLRRVGDFAGHWSAKDYEHGLQRDVLAQVAPFGCEPSAGPSRIQLARLRTAWLAAQRALLWAPEPGAAEAWAAGQCGEEPGEVAGRLTNQEARREADGLEADWEAQAPASGEAFAADEAEPEAGFAAPAEAPEEAGRERPGAAAEGGGGDAEAGDLGSQLFAAEQQVAELQAAARASEERHAAGLERQALKHAAEVERLGEQHKKELERQAAQRLHLEEQVRERGQLSRERDGRCSDLEQQLGEALRQIEEQSEGKEALRLANSEQDRLVEKLGELHIELAQVRQAGAEDAKALRAREAELADMRSAAEQARERRGALEAELRVELADAREARAAQLRSGEHLAELRIELAEARKVGTVDAAALRARDAELTDLRRASERAEERRSALEAELRVKLADARELRVELADAREAQAAQHLAVQHNAELRVELAEARKAGAVDAAAHRAREAELADLRRAAKRGEERRGALEAEARASRQHAGARLAEAMVRCQAMRRCLDVAAARNEGRLRCLEHTPASHIGSEGQLSHRSSYRELTLLEVEGSLRLPLDVASRLSQASHSGSDGQRSAHSSDRELALPDNSDLQLSPNDIHWERFSTEASTSDSPELRRLLQPQGGAEGAPHQCCGSWRAPATGTPLSARAEPLRGRGALDLGGRGWARGLWRA